MLHFFRVKLFPLYLFITFFLFLITGCSGQPGQQLVFMNSNQEQPFKVVLEQKGKEIASKTIKPKSNVFIYVPLGIYEVKVYDIKGESIRHSELATSNKTKNSNTYPYMLIDIEGKTSYLLIISNFLYKAEKGSIADAIYKGRAKDKLIQHYYKVGEPIVLGFKPNLPWEALPESMSSVDNSWTLVPVVKKLKTKNEVYSYIIDYLNSLEAN